MGPSSFNDGNWSGPGTWPGPCPLQWGRRLSTTETRAAVLIASRAHKLQWGRRLSTTETCDWQCDDGRIVGCFNGAVVFQRRKLITTGWHLCSQAGFNGAVVFQRRKLESVISMECTVTTLQWGRRLSTTETTFDSTETAQPYMLQWGRRLSTTETALNMLGGDPAALASMGPSSFNDGNVAVPYSVAYPTEALQWGRRLSTTETGDVAIKLIDPANRFNGAVVFQRRKREAAGVERVSRVVASMGPSSFNDGNWEMERGAQADCQSFNGAVVFQRRKLLNLLFFSLQVIWLQWGRRLSTTETSRR